MSGPIVVAEYDAAWPERFARERERIVEACGADALVAIEHVGSTSVPGLAAKPIVDVMGGLRSLADAAAIVEPLATLGYEYVAEYERPSPRWRAMPERRYFRKDERGARTFQLHVVEIGGDFWVRHLAFRDYLRAHPEMAREYAALKRELAARSADVFAYTAGKDDFIARVEALAISARR